MVTKKEKVLILKKERRNFLIKIKKILDQKAIQIIQNILKNKKKILQQMIVKEKNLVL